MQTQQYTKVKLKITLRKYWRLWAKALGEKAGATKQEADRVALIRSAIVLCYIVTNFFIVAGVIRHW
jgi:uncharacterized membrane protein YwzB